MRRGQHVLNDSCQRQMSRDHRVPVLTFHQFQLAAVVFLITATVFAPPSTAGNDEPNAAKPAAPQQTEVQRPKMEQHAAEGPAGTSVANARPTKLSVPPKEALAAASQKMRTAFASDIDTADTALKKQKLASHFLDLALANQDAAEKWVLFTESLSLAVDAADIPLTEKILVGLDKLYAVDVHEARLAAYTKLAQNRNADSSPDLVQALIDTAMNAAAESRFQTAERAAKLAVARTRRQRNDALVKHAADVQKTIAARQKAEQELATLREKLAASPDDAALAAQVGRKLCFNVDDWDAGLPLLAKGSDAALARLAAATLALPAAPAGIAAVGDGWWQWAESQDQSIRGKVRHKAASLYRKAVPGLTGLDRAAVEKRITEAGVLANRGKGTGKTVYVVDLPTAPKQTNMHSYSANGTYGGKQIVCQNQHYPKAIITVPKTASTATVTCEVPSGAVAFVGSVGVFTIEPIGSGAVWQISTPAFFEIYVDGVRAWRSPPVSDSKVATPFEVPLAAPKTIELRVIYDSPAGLCTAAWLDPSFGM